MPSGPRPIAPPRGRPITSRLLNQVVDALAQRIMLPDGGQVRRVANNLVIRQAEPRKIGGRGFTALIAAAAPLAGASNRWTYGWQEGRTRGDGFEILAGGRSGTVGTNYALNLAELYHNSTYAWGVDTTGADYPPGFAAKPVGGGGTGGGVVNPRVVWMHKLTDLDGSVRYWFEATGSHDGTCE